MSFIGWKLLQIFVCGSLLGISLAQIPYDINNKKGFVNEYGYPFETYTVQTSDGYILALDRIPYGKISLPGNGTKRPIAFLMHETWGDSGSWIVKGPSHGLAFLLAEKGYDVWMGNNRGSYPSRRHITKVPVDASFWDFTLQELAVYDLHSMVQFALNKTGQTTMLYFGHSQGATLLFILVSEMPVYNTVFKGAVSLAPTVYLNYSDSMITNFAPYLGILQNLANSFKIYEYLPYSPFNTKLMSTFCAKGRLTRPLCNRVITAIWGPTYDENFNYTFISTVFPVGSSIKLKWQLLQYMSTGLFAKYDYGTKENIIKYNSLVPPLYNLGNVNVSLVTYSGGNDCLVTNEDLARLAYETRNAFLQLTAPDYNHLDLLWASDVGTKFYPRLMEVARFLNFPTN